MTAVFTGLHVGVDDIHKTAFVSFYNGVMRLLSVGLNAVFTLII